MTWILALAVAGLAVALYLVRRDLLTRLNDVERTIAAMAARLPEPVDPDRVVAEPPTIRGTTIRDWLFHHTTGRYRWSDAVREFYTRVLQDHPAVVPYFHTVSDLPTLQAHFTRVMVRLTNEGLRQRDLDHLAKVHRNVRTPDGVPITAEIYDEVIGVFVGVLKEWNVPSPAINELVPAIDLLRGVIVAPETVRAE